MLSRGDQFVFKAAFYGVTSALLLSTSALVAAADDSETVSIDASTPPAAASTPAVRTMPEGLTVSGTTVMMAPIPDKAPAQRAAVAAAPVETSSANEIAIQPISLTERPAIIIRNGTITMDPIVDRGALEHASVDDKPRLTKADAEVSTGGNELNCLARAVYFEARGESTRGQTAVAQVVLARKRQPGRPKTICGVVYEGSHLSTGCQFSFTCDGIADTINNRAAWTRAKSIASRAMRGKLKSVARGATYFHANYVRPYWASSMVKVATIGTHVFYRP